MRYRGHVEEPSPGLFHGPHQAVRLHKLGKDVLEDVLHVALVSHSPSDEAAEPGPLPLRGLGDSEVLLGDPPGAQRVLHLQVYTDEGRGYFMSGSGLGIRAPRTWRSGAFGKGTGDPNHRRKAGDLPIIHMGTRKGSAHEERP